MILILKSIEKYKQNIIGKKFYFIMCNEINVHDTGGGGGAFFMFVEMDVFLQYRIFGTIITHLLKV